LSDDDITLLATLDIEGIEDLDSLMEKLEEAKTEGIITDSATNASNINSVLSAYTEGNLYGDLDSD
jgi:hypothetical protein